MSTALFPACVLPGCRNPVEQVGDACAECPALFEDYLRPGGPRLTAAQITARDQEVRDAYRKQGKPR